MAASSGIFARMSALQTYTYRYPRPALTVDAIVLRHGAGGVEVLLIQRDRPPFEGGWAIPGGFFDLDDVSVEAAALRELHEETGLELGRLELLGPYSAPDRDPRERVISLVYYGWAEADANPTAGDDARALAWHPLGQLPTLAFDHAQVLADLRMRLKL